MKPIMPSSPSALDPQALSGLKRAAKGDARSPETLKQVAQQFEALFLQMMLKSMREASLGDEVFGSDQGDFYRDLHDQQLATMLAKRQGIGLADVLVRQLGGSGAAITPAAPAEAPRSSTRGVDPGEQRRRFTESLWPHAERAGRALGVEPEAIVAVAALETGWGQSPIRRADGSSANNLFGIKAGADWRGERVHAQTREVFDGVPVVRREPFRAYGSLAEGVDDFARFLRANPRYREALAAGADSAAFARGLSAAGYATDPAYGRKLESILGGDALRVAMGAFKNSGDRPIVA
jgi:flagellar protein FlgJ